MFPWWAIGCCVAVTGDSKETLWYMREAEIKHSRLAMLAVVGWPLAELYDQPIAQLIGRPALLTKSGESPLLLNGGLGQNRYRVLGVGHSISRIGRGSLKHQRKKLGLHETMQLERKYSSS
jgi:hypothetical protein